MQWNYAEQNRTGDHKWWISDSRSFARDYPEWRLEYDVPEILQEIYDANVERWMEAAVAMIDRGRHNVLGVRIDAVDYDAAAERIVGAAQQRSRWPFRRWRCMA